MSSQETLTVVGAIIRDGDTVLAARRKPDRSAGGFWEFPGGKVEESESPKEALRRELHEELGINIVVGDLASRHSTPLGSRLIDLACYWATVQGELPEESTDHDQLEWVSLSKLSNRHWSPADIPIINDIAQ